MSDSDEERLLLEDESMDEMYELDDALQVSIDTNASSPVKRNGHRSDSSDDEEKSSDSDDDESDASDESSMEIPANPSVVQFPDAEEDRVAQDSDDEPPEIPGSPIATAIRTVVNDAEQRNSMLQLQGAALAMGHADVLTIHRDSDSDSNDGDEYAVREQEQPRSAEFHAGSSSSDSGNSDDDDGSDSDSKTSRGVREKKKLHIHQQQNRPKTAAKDLECYRDVVPNEFFQQMAVGEPSESVEGNHPKKRQSSTKSKEPNGALPDRSPVVSRSNEKRQLSKYVVPVPQEVEHLFQLVDAYTPDHIEIETRLEPFVPEYMPTIGLPFDGIQMPRPDGKEEKEAIGLQVLKEPSMHSNVAELELLLEANLKQKQRNKSSDKAAFVHSIDDAEHRPREIDQWIESVANVQRTKPLANVVYTKPMPTLESLMELWPEEMEAFLVANNGISISNLDVTLPELVKLVCVVLDIPLYEGNHIQSLHLLFSLYHEIEAYEREMQQSNSIR